MCETRGRRATPHERASLDVLGHESGASPMTSGDTRIERAGLKVSKILDDYVANELLHMVGINVDAYWRSFAEIVAEFLPRIDAVLESRLTLQRQLDTWLPEHAGASIEEHRRFLLQIGYLEEQRDVASIAIDRVDREIAAIAGPQLVVPLDNARFALNAANARWGSLYDALYGTNVIPEDGDLARGSSYNATRGERVIEFANQFLDSAVPLETGSYADVREYRLSVSLPTELTVELNDGRVSGLRDPNQFVGFAVDGISKRLLLVNHGLHIEIDVNREHPIGEKNPTGVADVILESAVTTIQDCEDSVAVVDADDKVVAYRNWLGLMAGTLQATFQKGGVEHTRRLEGDRSYVARDGSPLVLRGRSLLLIRNVGFHMKSDIVETADGRNIPESLLDIMVNATTALIDLRRLGRYPNSEVENVYFVMPKMHGSGEVALAVDIFAAVEKTLGLSANTIKIGIMDEERRTSLNLSNCIGAARERVIFINTGFLDRTGDEIHTVMTSGAVVRKEEMRSEPWLVTYERNNVDVALAMGFQGVAQIGKGMWTMPDAMAEMLEQKIVQLKAGASCAWVPSPTAATLHALHYHDVDVAERQNEIASQPSPDASDLLRLPLLGRSLSDSEIAEVLKINAQSILGYVVRWVDQGIGCSKVPDLNGVGLMEDRATLRISSQLLANWLSHGLVARDDITLAFVDMAGLVDQQNGGDMAYWPMMPNPLSSLGMGAALELVFQGRESPNGYTEGVLNTWRRRAKEVQDNEATGE